VQFSLFGAEAAEPTLDDLAGVLLAGGQWVRSGDRARLSIVVADAWRADALVMEFAARGVAADSGDGTAPTPGGIVARTAFSDSLHAIARPWRRGANDSPPDDFTLTAGGLRLWTLAAGRRDEAGYLLATAQPEDAVHRAAGAQLSRFGLAAVSLTRRGGGPGWRISSQRRLRRLAELVGEAPPGAGADWPATG